MSRIVSPPRPRPWPALACRSGPFIPAPSGTPLRIMFHGIWNDHPGALVIFPDRANRRGNHGVGYSAHGHANHGGMFSSLCVNRGSADGAEERLKDPAGVGGTLIALSRPCDGHHLSGVIGEDAEGGAGPPPTVAAMARDDGGGRPWERRRQLSALALGFDAQSPRQTDDTAPPWMGNTGTTRRRFGRGPRARLVRNFRSWWSDRLGLKVGVERTRTNADPDDHTPSSPAAAHARPAPLTLPTKDPRHAPPRTQAYALKP